MTTDRVSNKPRPVDVVLGVYAVLSGLVLFFPGRPSSAPLLLAGHILLFLGCMRLPPVAGVLRVFALWRPRIGRVLGAWYPLILIPALYAELDILNLVIWEGHFFDGPVIALEEWVFGFYPSSDLARRAPFTLLSELLHLSYLSYYFIIYGPPLILYLQGRLDAFDGVVLGVMVAFLAHYLCFMTFPVEGPFFRGGLLLADTPDGPLKRFALSLSQAGATKGATFPSSHVGVAVAQATLAYRFLPRLFPVLLICALGVAVGAVYCGYHYGVDSLAGAAMGWALAYLTIRYWVRRGGNQGRPPASNSASILASE